MTVSLTTLGDEATILMGQSPPGASYNADGRGFPLLNGPTEFGESHPTERQWTTSPTKICAAGDILFCVRGATAGRLNVADKEYCLGRGVAAIRGKAEKFDTKFLRHALARGYKELQSRAVGSTFINISGEQLAAFSLPALGLSEQRRIAEVLDRAEALRAKRRAALAQLDTLTQAIFLDLFGDPVTNPRRWPIRALKELGKVKTGGTPPSAKPGMFGGPIPFITPGDLDSSAPAKRTVTEDGASECETVRAGAALVCCIGATIGKMAKTTKWSAFNQQINAVEWHSGTDDDYGLAVLRFFKVQIARWGASTTLPILKKSAFERIEVPIAPFDLQREFARRVAAVEKLKAAQRASLAEMDALFASLQHRAFRGEL